MEKTTTTTKPKAETAKSPVKTQEPPVKVDKKEPMAKMEVHPWVEEQLKNNSHPLDGAHPLRGVLFKKIGLVAQEIGSIAKRGRNDWLGFDFITHVDASNALLEAMLKVGIWCTPEILSYDTETWEAYGERKQDADKKTVWHRTTLHMNIRVVDTETGYAEYFAWKGTEQDTQGKDFQQAVSAAYKYWMFKTFLMTDKASAADSDSQTSPIEKGAVRTGRKKTGDPFFDSLPGEFAYDVTHGDTRQWLPKDKKATYIDHYKKNPTKEIATKLFHERFRQYKMGRTEYKEVLVALNLFTAEGEPAT